MNKIIRLVVVSVLFLTACAPPALPTSTPAARGAPRATETTPISGAPTIEPTLAALQLAVYPPEARTGQGELDPIIDAMLAHDFQVLQELTAYTQIACTNADGLGGPPKCTSNEDEGTIVEVVPFLGPEGHHQRRGDYESWEGPDVLGLLAAYRTSSGTYSDPSFPAGEYGLVFLLGSGDQILILQVTGGRIIRFDYYFGILTNADLEQKSVEMLLPLTFRPLPTPVSWNLFQDPAERISFLYPPPLHLLPADLADSWHLGSRIRIEVLSFDQSWISCFYQSLSNCPFVESDRSVDINGQEVRRIEGYIGAVGGNIPQEFLSYIFNLGDDALVLTIYALPFGIQPSDPAIIWPLEGMELELFERIIDSTQLID